MKLNLLFDLQYSDNLQTLLSSDINSGELVIKEEYKSKFYLAELTRIYPLRVMLAIGAK